MRILGFDNIWRDFYDRRVGEFNDFLFKFASTNEGYTFLLFQSAQENYLMGVYFDYLAKLSKKNPSLINEEEVRELLAYDFCNIDSEELNYDKYIELSEFYLYRPTNSFVEDRYRSFNRNCKYLLFNKEGYASRIKMYLNNSEDLGLVYTDYLFDDIKEQKKLYKKTSKRLEEILHGDEVGDKDYQLLIENYKRLYLKERIYDEILPLCKDPEVNLNLLSYNFAFLNSEKDKERNVYLFDRVDDSKEKKPLKILDDYLDFCDELDNTYEVVNKKSKILKK